MKKNMKVFLAILFSLVLVFGAFGVANIAFAEDGHLSVDGSGGNEDEIIFGSQTKEDGYIGTEMPVSIDENATETDYYIESLEQFMNFQEISKANNFAGLTVHLAANVSLDDSFAGIGSEEVPFAGTFDGHGYAITKLSSSNGLFVAVEGATIQKLVVGGAKVMASEANAYAGILVGTANGATVDKVIITRSKIATDVAETVAIGGMFGKVSGNVSISDSTVRRLIVKTVGETTVASSFVGYAETTATTNNYAVVNSYENGTFVNCSVLGQ